MKTTDYTNAAQQRILALVLYLFGDVINGYSPGALAKALETTNSNITRDLANLAAAGLAEKIETGNWRLTNRLPQQAAKVFATVDRVVRDAHAYIPASSRYNNS